MKTTLVCLAVLLSMVVSPAQGTVNFFNGPGYLVSAGLPGQEMLIEGPAGTYYFGLLIAPVGTVQPAQFAFTGAYATNVATLPGQLFGGRSVPVKDWRPGTFMSFLVAGWSASLGHDWNQAWLSGEFAGAGYFGLSGLAAGQSGDPAPTPLPPLNLFGGASGIQTGFDLVPVPEPSVMALAAAAALLLRYGRSRRAGTPQERT